MSWIECPAANFCPPCTSPSSPSKWVGLAWAGREGARPLYKGQVFLPGEEEEDRIYRTTYRRPNVRGEGAVSVSVAIGGWVCYTAAVEDGMGEAKLGRPSLGTSPGAGSLKNSEYPNSILRTYRTRKTRARPRPLLQPSKLRICALDSERIHQLFSL